MLKLKKVEEPLFFLTILFLPTQLGRHFWPKFSFVYSLPIDYLSPTIYFWDLLVILLIVFWVAQKKFVNKLALNLFLLFMLSQLLSLIPQTYDFNEEGLGAGLVRLEQYLIAGLMGVYIASSKFPGLAPRSGAGKIQNSKLYWPLLLAVLFESILAIAQFIKGGTLGFWILGERTFSISTPAIAKFDFYGREFLRPYGTFPHPNVLAAFLVISGILLKTKLTTFWAGLVILLTVSRTAIIAGFVVSLFLLTKKWKMVLVLLILIMSPFLYTRFTSLFNYDQLTFLRREELSLTAWAIFLKNPLFGVGLNNFIPYVSEQIVAGPSRFLQPVHNIFLLTLAETGILGLLGLLGLIGYPILILFKIRNVRQVERLRGTKFEIRNLLFIWAIIIFLGLFDHYFLTLPQGYRMLFLMWGMSLSMLESELS